eukprot:4971646-Pyramimonas_sp.AAC.1
MGNLYLLGSPLLLVGHNCSSALIFFAVKSSPSLRRIQWFGGSIGRPQYVGGERVVLVLFRFAAIVDRDARQRSQRIYMVGGGWCCCCPPKIAMLRT